MSEDTENKCFGKTNVFRKFWVMNWRNEDEKPERTKSIYLGYAFRLATCCEYHAKKYLENSTLATENYYILNESGNF